MSLFPTRTVTVEVPAPTPPTLSDKLNGAAASSEYARSVFRDAVDELVAANAELDDIEIRATSEIDSLTEIRSEAAARRRANVETIEKLQALIG